MSYFEPVAINRLCFKDDNVCNTTVANHAPKMSLADLVNCFQNYCRVPGGGESWIDVITTAL